MTRRARILVVDDEPGVRSSLQRMLARDYEVIVAGSCDEARQNTDLEVDLAVVDLVLPDGDGFELLQELRQRPERPEVIIITGDTADADEKLARALRGRAFYFLTKPFESIALETLVQRSLEVRELQRRLHQRSAELERDLKLARDFQRGLMPARRLEQPGLTIRPWFASCDRLAGDYFDYRVRGEQVLFIVADVVGHGISAAMLAGMLASAWSRALRDRLSLAAIHHRLLDMVQDWEDQQFFSAFLGAVDLRHGVLRYINAGHPAPVHRGPTGETTFLHPNAPVISPAIDDVEIEAMTVKAAAGVRVLVFSDGLTECRSPSGEFLGLGPVVGAVKEYPDVVKMLATIRELVERHEGGRPQEDDITVLGLAFD